MSETMLSERPLRTASTSDVRAVLVSSGAARTGLSPDMCVWIASNSACNLAVVHEHPSGWGLPASFFGGLLHQIIYGFGHKQEDGKSCFDLFKGCIVCTQQEADCGVTRPTGVAVAVGSPPLRPLLVVLMLRRHGCRDC